MNLPNSSVESPSSSEEQPNPVVLSDQPNGSMLEYYQLQNELWVIMLVLAGIIFVTVCFFYPFRIACNYLLGAVGSLVYLRMLAKDVEKLGREQQSLSKARLGIVVGLIVVATQWDQLQILPIFLGFLTYKAALIFYVLKATLMPDPGSSQ
ncbi:MAG: ATP synthase subunit I [Microcoleaceae cyanobacterium]